LFAIPKSSLKAGLVRKMENNCGSPETADHEIVAGSEEVRFPGTLMVNAETSGIAQANAMLRRRLETIVLITGRGANYE